MTDVFNASSSLVLALVLASVLALVLASVLSGSRLLKKEPTTWLGLITEVTRPGDDSTRPTLQRSVLLKASAGRVDHAQADNRFLLVDQAGERGRMTTTVARSSVTQRRTARAEVTAYEYGVAVKWERE